MFLYYTIPMLDMVLLTFIYCILNTGLTEYTSNRQAFTNSSRSFTLRFQFSLAKIIRYRHLSSSHKKHRSIMYPTIDTQTWSGSFTMVPTRRKGLKIRPNSPSPPYIRLPHYYHRRHRYIISRPKQSSRHFQMIFSNAFFWTNMC